MADLMQAAILLLPLYQALKAKMLASDYLIAAETPLPVLTKDKPGATHKGYHWVYYDPVRRLVLFDYRKTRGREGPNEMHKEFAGYLQTDGYNAYDHFENRSEITLLACMAHVQRKFEHALENNPTLAANAMKMFQSLYEIEREISERDLEADAIKMLRQRKSKPVIDQMEVGLKEQIIQVPPKSAIGVAIAYTLNLWPRLIRYINDERLHIDNNFIENSIRPVALGRKN
ncbi:MAG: IS66 family transposase [Bacteroidales bacterium]|nr:IS66 family transposase [Bacteroidales bacterium]